MKLFLDTADVDAIRRASATGLLRGVTTNPTHVSKTGREFVGLVKEICDIVPGHVSVEAMGESTDELVAEGRNLAKLAPPIVVKIPMTPEGMAAVSILEKEHKVRTNVTMVFSATQAFLAMAAGASFVSLVLSRLEAVGQPIEQFVEDTMTIQGRYGFESEILAASIKTQPCLLTCLRAGVDVATLPPPVFDQLFEHPLTRAGLEQFAKDWEAVRR
jgi:transaldolase